MPGKKDGEENGLDGVREMVGDAGKEEEILNRIPDEVGETGTCGAHTKRRRAEDAARLPEKRRRRRTWGHAYGGPLIGSVVRGEMLKTWSKVRRGTLSKIQADVYFPNRCKVSGGRKILLSTIPENCC